MSDRLEPIGMFMISAGLFSSNVKSPDLSSFKIFKELSIAIRVQFSIPNYLCVIDIGGVNPFRTSPKIAGVMPNVPDAITRWRPLGGLPRPLFALAGGSNHSRNF